MRQVITISSLVILAGVTLLGQGMTCTRQDTPAATMRAEGLSELAPDLILSCTGGTPTAAGSPVPQYEVLAIASVPLVNRAITPPTPTQVSLDAPLTSVLYWTDALLILDEAPSRYQVACVPAGASEGCAAKAGDATNPNTFQGKRIQDNVLVFSKIPIDAPGAGKTRIIRITNLRVNPSKLPKTAPDVTLTAQVFDYKGAQLSTDTNILKPVATAKPSYTFSVRTASDGAVDSKDAALTLTPAMVPQNFPTSSTAFNVKFTESFAGAFRRRNLGTSGIDPNLLVTQADPGVFMNTESGVFNTNFPIANGLSTAGLADSGTRLLVTVSNIPENVMLWASGRDVATGTTDYSDATPHALLTYTSANGDGPFSQTFPAYGYSAPVGSGFSLIYPDNGTATIVYEIVSADPYKIENLSFEIRLLALNGPARLGSATVLGRLGPVFPGRPVPNQATIAPEPSFVETSLDPVTAFRLVPTISQSPLTGVSAASYTGTTVAPGSLIAAFGAKLSNTTEISGSTPATKLAGVNVDVIDITGARRTSQLMLVSPGQINFILDAATKPGQAVLTVSNSGQSIATGYLMVEPIAPGLFSAAGSGAGTAAGVAAYNDSSGSHSALLFHSDALRGIVADPVDVKSGNVFLTLYGTGFRALSGIPGAKLAVGGETIPITFAGAQGQFEGLDQINAGPLPVTLSGKGEVTIVFTADGKTANTLTMQVK